jgi:hypothetical protein
MTRGIKHNYKEIKDYIEQFGCKLISTEYKSMDDKLTIECVCLNKWETTFYSFKNTCHHRCHDCSNTQRLTFETVKSIIENFGYYLLSIEYKNSITPLIIKDNDNYLYYISFSDIFTEFKRGAKPHVFVPSNIFVIENIKLWIKLNNKPFELISQKYINKNDKIDFYCCKCKNVFDVSLNNLRWHQKGCPYCVGKRVSIKNSLYENFKELSLEWDYLINKGNPKDYSYGSHYKAGWICPDCEYKWFASIHDRTNNKSGCPCCRKSKGELIIHKKLTSLELYFISQYRFIDCKNERSLPFDFYLPIQNVCIEYQGRQHYESVNAWGGVKEYDKIKLNDSIKKEYCKKNNIKFLSISYLDFKNIEKILEDALNLRGREIYGTN